MNKTLILAIIVLTPMMLFYFYSRWDYSSSKKLYTISKSIKQRGIRGQSELTVHIEYNNEFYTLYHTPSQSCIQRAKKGEVLLIEFLEKDPSLGRILCDYTIPDSIIVNPKVWDSIPSFLKKME